MSDLDASKFWLDALKWDESGMIPAIAQEATLAFPVYLTEAQARGSARLRVSYISSISVAPASSAPRKM